jgi:RNA polymerase sigma-70 factor (ECF subfamily)
MIELIPRLRRYARALVGEQAAAEDLVQSTLERGWDKLALHRPGGDLRAWLFTVMHNLYVDRLRAARPTDPLREQQDLQRALAQLPAEQREVLLLVTLEDMKYEEVADTLGIPVGTVMSRLCRAREKLRALLLGQGKLRVIK